MCITTAEVVCSHFSHLQEDIEQSGVDELFEALDNDKDGKVDLKEYMALINAMFE